MLDWHVAYQRRIVDDLLDSVFVPGGLAAVALEGAKGVGKTATGTQRASTVLTLTDPGQREALAANPDLVVQLPAPVLIDEWQLEPSLWDRVRHAVDAEASGGRFLLAGSAGVAPGVRIHSGAARIVRMGMRPLTLSERGSPMATVSLGALLTGDIAEVEGTSEVSLSDYVDEILRSGFPGIRNLPERARQLQLDSYLSRIVERELPESGATVRRPAALRAWLAAYAAATSTDAGYVTILDAATPGEGDKPARQTADVYREHLSRIFLLDPIDAWIPAFAPLKRLTLTPKHHLVDPALAARLVGVGKQGLLRGAEQPLPGTRTATWLGALFESLATQSVRVYAEAAGARTGHLRTKNTEREIDLIVEGDDHQVVAIEVKLANTVEAADVRHLNWLLGVIGERLAARVVLYSGRYAYRRPDGVLVVPLALLGP